MATRIIGFVSFCLTTAPLVHAQDAVNMVLTRSAAERNLTAEELGLLIESVYGIPTVTAQPFGNSALLRGTVGRPEEAQQIVLLAETYFDQVTSEIVVREDLLPIRGAMYKLETSSKTARNPLANALPQLVHRTGPVAYGAIDAHELSAILNDGRPVDYSLEVRTHAVLQAFYLRPTWVLVGAELSQRAHSFEGTQVKITPAKRGDRVHFALQFEDIQIIHPHADPNAHRALPDIHRVCVEFDVELASKQALLVAWPSSLVETDNEDAEYILLIMTPIFPTLTIRSP